MTPYLVLFGILFAGMVGLWLLPGLPGMAARPAINMLARVEAPCLTVFVGSPSPADTACVQAVVGGLYRVESYGYIDGELAITLEPVHLKTIDSEDVIDLREILS